MTQDHRHLEPRIRLYTAESSYGGWSATACWSSTRSATCRSSVKPRTALRHGRPRYEQGSIIVTSNRGFKAWGEILGDAMVAADRRIHHAHIITPRGKSYRLRSGAPRPRRRP